MLAVAHLLLALTVIGGPQQSVLVRDTFSSLPSCVRSTLKERIAGVAVTEYWAFGEEYDGVATPDGLIVLVDTPDDSLRLQLLHEFGHEVDESIDGVTPEFRRTLRADFATMTPAQRRELAYYREPEEAFAELFAERYDPTYRSDGGPEIGPLVLSRQVLNEELDRLESCASQDAQGSIRAEIPQ